MMSSIEISSSSLNHYEESLGSINRKSSVSSCKEGQTSLSIKNNLLNPNQEKSSSLNRSMAQLPTPSFELTPSVKKTKEVISQLKNESLEERACLDVNGGFFALDAAAFKEKASHQEQHILLINSSKQVKLFWDIIKPLLLKTKKRKDFIKMLEILFLSHSANFFSGDTNTVQQLASESISNLREEISNRTSWLSKSSTYKIIQGIFSTERFHHIDRDLLEKESVSIISGKLASIKSKLSVVYLGNRYVREKKRGKLIDFQNFVWHIQPHTNPLSLIIDIVEDEMRIRSYLAPGKVSEFFPPDRIELTDQEKGIAYAYKSYVPEILKGVEKSIPSEKAKFTQKAPRRLSPLKLPEKATPPATLNASSLNPIHLSPDTKFQHKRILSVVNEMVTKDGTLIGEESQSDF